MRRENLNKAYTGSVNSGPILQSATIEVDSSKLLKSITFNLLGKNEGTIIGNLHCGVFAVTGATLLKFKSYSYKFTRMGYNAGITEEEAEYDPETGALIVNTDVNLRGPINIPSEESTIISLNNNSGSRTTSNKVKWFNDFKEEICTNISF